jgi:type IV secretory pathway VirD2 relaxase
MNFVKHKFIAARGKGGVGKVAAIGKALAHVKYIQHRPGQDREQGGREMFNDKEDRLAGRDARQAIRELGNSKVIAHKLTLSPEVTPKDRKAFTREVMQKLSREKGSDLEWFAVQHSNTDHPHIHVVVLGKDRNGTEVNISFKDIEKMHEYGDRYLERHHGREFQLAKEAREQKERDRLDGIKHEREERYREGLELPWMKRNIIREQLEPYKEWKQKQDQKPKEKTNDRSEPERPFHNDTITAAGKEWSRADKLEDLKALNEHLWDNYEDRIPIDDYKKLVGWMKDKEHAKDSSREERSPKDKGSDKEKEREHERKKDFFEHGGKKYANKDSYEKLTGLAKDLREKKEKLPVEDYQNLRKWIEDRDRARFAGAMEKAMEDVLVKTEKSRTPDELKAMEGGRVVDPLQDSMMRNPVIGLFMKVASIANEVVRMIPLTENRDHLKDNREDLEKARIDIDKEPERQRDGLDDLLDGGASKTREQKEQKREGIEKGIERNEAAQKERERKAKEKKEDKEREDRDRENFEQSWWGR